MANADTPFGFRPIKHRNGAPYNSAANPYHVTNASNNALFIGDPVVIVGTSNTAAISVPGGGTFAIGTLPDILRASAGAGNRITGIIVGFYASPTALEDQYRVDATERVALVCDDPDVVFECQADSATDLAATSVGAAFNFVLTHGGSVTSGLSGAELDGSDEGTDPQDQLILTRFVNRDDNDATLTHAKCEVVISTHTFLPEGPVANDGLQGV